MAVPFNLLDLIAPESAHSVERGFAHAFGEVGVGFMEKTNIGDS